MFAFEVKTRPRVHGVLQGLMAAVWSEGLGVWATGGPPERPRVPFRAPLLAPGGAGLDG